MRRRVPLPGRNRRSDRWSFRAPLALLAILPVIAGCSSSGTGGAARDRVARQAGGVLSVLRAGLSHPSSGAAYYLSLGDSLSVGIQPGPAGRNRPTSGSYPDQLAAQLRQVLPSLQLVKLGCSGETTVTMIRGGICHYRAGDQLAQALRFLRSHQGRVALVTIDIGANDPNSCILHTPLANVVRCLSDRISQTERNLTTILARLRSAAGPRVLVVGMTYYVPELALWRKSRTGKEIAVLTESIAAGVNQLLIARYHRFGAHVADVYAAFRSGDFAGATRGHDWIARTGVTPPNVTAICSLTWMCAAPPRGPNEHANDAGYHRIAEAFWSAISR